MRKPSKPVVVALVAIQTASALIALRDLAARPDDQVRGSKKFWRIFVALNPGNSLAYWAVGRR